MSGVASQPDLKCLVEGESDRRDDADPPEVRVLAAEGETVHAAAFAVQNLVKQRRHSWRRPVCRQGRASLLNQLLSLERERNNLAERSANATVPRQTDALRAVIEKHSSSARIQQQWGATGDHRRVVAEARWNVKHAVE